MIRSAIFNIVLFVSLSVYMLFGLFLLPCSTDVLYQYWFGFSRLFNFITKYVGGISYKIVNPQNVTDNNVIYAVRHESMWETVFLISFFKKPVFIMKQELREIPIFGLLSEKVNAIFVDRNQGMKALINASRKVTTSLKEGCQVVMFPEGTRLQPGEYVPLKRGIALFYKTNNCTVVPVVHNSGTFWSRRSFRKNPGEITVKFLDPIAPGL